MIAGSWKYIHALCIWEHLIVINFNVFLVDEKSNDGIEDQVAEDIQQQIPSEDSLEKGLKVV